MSDILMYQKRSSGYDLINPYFQDAELNSLFGIDATGTNKDLWKAVAKYNQYWWRKTPLPVTGYKEVQIVLSSNQEYNFIRNRSYQYSTSVNINQGTGKVTLKNPKTIAIGSLSPRAVYNAKVEEIRALTPFYTTGQNGSDIFYVSNSSAIWNNYDSDDGYGTISIYGGRDTSNLYLVSSVAFSTPSTESVSYVYNTNIGAYPQNGDLNGYHYEMLGVPINNLVLCSKITSGSYIGTRTYGSSNQNSLNFNFIPKIVIVARDTQWGFEPYDGFFYIGQKGQESARIFSLSNNILSWYSTVDNRRQCNIQGTLYYYIAFG